jgi:hypothetical protein
MSIPIIMLLHFIIDEYASKQPGSKSAQSEVIVPSSSETDDTLQSDFGKLIISGAVGDAEKMSSADAALLAYAGKADR